MSLWVYFVVIVGSAITLMVLAILALYAADRFKLTGSKRTFVLVLPPILAIAASITQIIYLAVPLFSNAVEYGASWGGLGAAALGILTIVIIGVVDLIAVSMAYIIQAAAEAIAFMKAD